MAKGRTTGAEGNDEAAVASKREEQREQKEMMERHLAQQKDIMQSR